MDFNKSLNGLNLQLGPVSGAAISLRKCFYGWVIDVTWAFFLGGVNYKIITLLDTKQFFLAPHKINKCLL